MKVTGAIVNLVGALSLVFGLYALYMGASITTKYSLYSASAVQITQVYSEGIYWGAMACAAFLFTLCCFMGASELERRA